MSGDRSRWPVMVRLGLWGLPSRGWAWVFFWVCVVIGAGGVVYGLVNPPFFIGSILLFAALWYYLAIRWVDRHSGWS